MRPKTYYFHGFKSSGGGSKFETMLKEQRTRDFIKSPVYDWSGNPNDPDD